MLTQFLPGLRELRAPLASGFLWMTLGWLFLHKTVAAAGGPTRELVELGQQATTPALFGAASFAAYIIGSLSNDAFAPGLEWAMVKLSVSKIVHKLESKQTEMSDAFREAEILRCRNETDRLEAECDLRVAILPPLVALVLYFSINDSPLWLLGLLTAPALGAQIWQRAVELGVAGLTLEELLQGTGLTTADSSRWSMPHHERRDPLDE